jgi:serine/threonine protein kinase/Tfp pilus assembly protein PilF
MVKPPIDPLPESLNSPSLKSEFLGLKNYKKLALICYGGMSEVYLAQDSRLNRMVAIKIINTNYSSSDDSYQNQLDNALTEARLLARLNHPNIVQLYDIEQEGNQIALIMEHLVGKTLHQYQQEHIIPLIQQLIIITQISAGLAAAHDKGVIHCDLKPSNIILSDDDTVKIVDFGIAHLTDNNNEAQQTINTKAQLYGSIDAMSPEQIYNATNQLAQGEQRGKNQTIDFRSDLFSLGIIAFNLLAGYHPLNGAGTQQTSTNMLKGNTLKKNIANANDIIPKLPEELSSLLNKLLSYDKESRPKSSAWVYKQFQQITKILTQQAELEQHTQALSPALLASHSIDNGSAKQPPIKIIASSVATLCIISFIAAQLHWFNPTTKEIRYVAVLQPTYTTKIVNTEKIKKIQMSPMQKELISLSTYGAIKQSIINNKQLKLIPESELLESSKGLNTRNQLVKIGKVTGATDIITTQLTCTNIKCDVVISRLIKKPADNDNDSTNWHIKSQQSWPTLLENYASIYQTTQSHVSAIFPKYTSTFLTEKVIKNQDYLAYANIYTQIAINNQINDQNLQLLADIIKKSPYLYSAYTLYRETSLDLYNTSRNKAYITDLQKLMQSAPPEYKYSVFQAIDNFAITNALGEHVASNQHLALIKERGIDPSSYIEMSAYLATFQSDWQRAITLYEQAIELRPSTKLLYNLALSYYQAGSIAQAITNLTAVLDILPEQYWSNQLLADIYLLTGKVELAIVHYKKSLSINIQSYDLNNLSLALLFTGKGPEAMMTAQRAVDLAPKHPTWRLNLADIQQMLGFNQQANKNYQTVIELRNKDKSLQSQLNIAQAHAHLGNFDAAIKAINNAKKIATSNSQVAYIAALVYVKAGEHTSAIIQVEEALSANTGGIWFDLPWFDPLCQHSKFIDLMKGIDKPERCQRLSAQNNKLPPH